MRIVIEFSTDNAAFEDPREVPAILRIISNKIDMGRNDGIVMDSNGNRVGEWEVTL